MSPIAGQENIEGISPNELDRFVRDVIIAISSRMNKSVSIALMSDAEIAGLNRLYRNKDSPTDVLSFPYTAEEFEKQPDFLGDIAISFDRAKAQAADSGIPLVIEVKQLILHGILHLFGFDHEIDDGEMNNLEIELRVKLGINR